MNKLVLFDIDKTLIKGLKWDDSKFSEAIKKVYGINVKVEIIGKKHSGMTDQEKIIALLKKKGLKEKEIMPKIKYCLKFLINSFKMLDNSNFIVLDGVKGLLEALKRNKIMIGIVTGNVKYIAKGKLKKAGIEKYFKVCGFGDDDKSRAKILRIAIKRARKIGFKGNDIFLIGDTPNDIKAGKKAGIKVIGVATGIWSKNQLKKSGADYVFKNLKNTKEILKIINNQKLK
ncbi:MAG: HAD family hydrolase [Candidatus Aenigmatarchaeota archaeon]